VSGIAGARGGNEVTEGPWRITLDAVDGRALRAGDAVEDKGPFARLLGTPDACGRQASSVI
jgi:hypothetical protein